MLTREEATWMNCKASNDARKSKANQLEREIRESSATADQKANMLHTLSKLGMFAQDERDFLTRAATDRRYDYYHDFLALAGG